MPPEIPARQEIPEIGTKPAPEVAVEDVEPAERNRTNRQVVQLYHGKNNQALRNPDDNSELMRIMLSL